MIAQIIFHLKQNWHFDFKSYNIQNKAKALDFYSHYPLTQTASGWYCYIFGIIHCIISNIVVNKVKSAICAYVLSHKCCFLCSDSNNKLYISGWSSQYTHAIIRVRTQRTDGNWSIWQELESRNDLTNWGLALLLAGIILPYCMLNFLPFKIMSSQIVLSRRWMDLLALCLWHKKYMHIYYLQISFYSDHFNIFWISSYQDIIMHWLL